MIESLRFKSLLSHNFSRSSLGLPSLNRGPKTRKRLKLEKNGSTPFQIWNSPATNCNLLFNKQRKIDFSLSFILSFKNHFFQRSTNFSTSPHASINDNLKIAWNLCFSKHFFSSHIYSQVCLQWCRSMAKCKKKKKKKKLPASNFECRLLRRLRRER